MNDSPDLPDSQEESDLDLLLASAAGGSAAFERLYGRYERRVYNYVRTFVRQPAVAEEVVIDTMTAVWHGARNCSRTSRVSTWIFGIARHKALDAVRAAARHDGQVALNQADEIIDTAADPLAATQEQRQALLIRQAMTQLSDDHQEILRLAFYEDLPYEEIAALLSIPDNTVKTRVFYAKQQLKRCLDRLGEQL
jgi:RNA polymerase sigma-70 factor (ECF subfamily)